MVFGHSGDQGAVFGKIIAAAVHLVPAGDHHAFFVKEIAASVDGLPAADAVAVLVEIEGLILQGQPLCLVGAVPEHIVPDSVVLIPFGRPVGIPVGPAGQSAAIDGHTAAAGRRLEMVAVVLAGRISPVPGIFHGSQNALHARIVVFQLKLQIGQLSVDRRIIIAVGSAPVAQTAVAPSGPLAETVAATARVPCMGIEGGFAADIGHDPAGCSLRVVQSLCEIVKNIVGVLLPGRGGHIGGSRASGRDRSGQRSGHQDRRQAPCGCDIFSGFKMFIDQ